MIINPYNVMYRRYEVIKKVPTLASDTITFNGNNQSPTINNYNSTSMVLSGDTSKRDVGNYTVTITPADGWAWQDGTQTPLNLNYSITKMSLAKPYLSNASKTFNNASQSPTVNSYNSTWETQSGTTSSTNVGSWTVTWKLKEPANTQWADKTVADVTGTWSIAVLKLTKPTYKSGNATYDGKAKTLAVNNYNSTYMTQGGTTSATNAGSYSATYTLKSTTNTKWSDNTTAVVTVSWSIARAKLATKPTVKTNPTYNGKAQSPAWNNYNTTYMTISGTTSATNAGSYTATFTLKGNYAWTDGTTAVASVKWTMNRLKVTKPTVKTNPTYNGKAQSPAWNNYNTTYMTIGGTTSATNAGSYNATFTLKSNWAWSDGGTGVLTVKWTMNRAAGSITLNPTSVSTTVGGTATFTITRSGNGAISVASGATGTATVSLSSTTVTVTGKAIGSATITVSVAQGTNHNATSKTLTATIKGANMYIWAYKYESNKYTSQCRYGFGDGSTTNGTSWQNIRPWSYSSYYNWNDHDGKYHNGEWGINDTYSLNDIYQMGGTLIFRLNKNAINLSGYNKLRFKIGISAQDSSTYRASVNAMYRECSFFITTETAPTAKTGKVYTVYSATQTIPQDNRTIRTSANYDMDISSLTGNQYIYLYLQGAISTVSSGGFYHYGLSCFFNQITSQTATPQYLYALLFN